jgi:hypothetical protein
MKQSLEDTECNKSNAIKAGLAILANRIGKLMKGSVLEAGRGLLFS